MIPDVVAGGDDIDPQCEQVAGDVSGNPATAGGVLAIDDYHLNLVPCLEDGQQGMDDPSTGFAHDVAEKK